MIKILQLDKKPVRGLLWAEWVMMGYALITTLLILLIYTRLDRPGEMLWGRGQAVLMTLALWGTYRLLPCRLMLLVRVVGQLSFLSWWYPDTFELNRVFTNLDHLFAAFDQTLFGCQPALLFSQVCPWPLFSELLTLGYVSYYPMMVAVLVFFFFFRYERFLRASFVLLASFFIFYVIFVALPVAGPQFYYPAVGTDQIAQGVFPAIGDYFSRVHFSMDDPSLALPAPGWEDGFFYHLLCQAHEAGERPTAAFPSSHVGIATVLLWLAWESRCRWLLYVLLPLCVLMFFATFYIQAHYVVDALAGLVAGTLMYFALRWAYGRGD